MPREPLSCNEAQSALAEIRSLRTEFERALEAAGAEDPLEAREKFLRAKELRSSLESRIHGLREGLISPLEKKLDLKRQYESQRQVLDTAGILERLPSPGGTEAQGIRGIDGKAYPMPTYQEVRGLIREKGDILGKKAEQGFTKLLIVPFGMGLDGLIGKYGELLIRHGVEGRLFAAKGNDTDPDEPLELDTDEPVWAWEEYGNADIDGRLIYGPKEFSQNHGGKTKAEMLAAAGQTPPGLAAWHIIIVEADPTIPRGGKGRDAGGRKRIEANRTPNEYLAMAGKGQYEGESGTTPEEWLMQAITLLEEKNQVLDDYQGNGSIAYNFGAYFPGSGNVPDAYWDRDNQQAFLFRNVPTSRVAYIGARSAVRV